MNWIRIKKNDADEWNEKLKCTNASFFQYPYYASGYKNFLFTYPLYLKLVNNSGNEIGFCCILKVQILFLKIGLIIRGPVFFNNYTDVSTAIELLKEYVREHHFIFLRINPEDTIVEEVLSSDKEFEVIDYFPSYKGSQLTDLLVYKRPQEALLKSFRDDCRNKIRFQNELDYRYGEITTGEELMQVYKLFSRLGSEKKFSYRPFTSYKKIFFEGVKHQLCSVYTAKLDQQIICAVFIVKDGISYTNFSGALKLNGIRAKYSPANNLHYLIMRDCFYNEHKIKYNLSFSTPGSGVYMFKTSFRPVEEKKPSFYTYVINKRIADFIMKTQQGSLKRLRG